MTTTPILNQRSDWASLEQIAPKVIEALMMLGKAVEDSGLEKQLTELIKLRASQLNGCAFCLQYHLNLSRKLGLAKEKIDLVATWRDAGIFSVRERAALAWTEALTLMAQKHIADSIYAELQCAFTEAEITFLSAAIANINAWNRIAGALQYPPLFPS